MGESELNYTHYVESTKMKAFKLQPILPGDDTAGHFVAGPKGFVLYMDNLVKPGRAKAQVRKLVRVLNKGWGA